MTIPAVIAEIPDEAYEVEKCAGHGRFLFFPNGFEIRLSNLVEIATCQLLQGYGRPVTKHIRRNT
jgi:hypothetical protein